MSLSQEIESKVSILDVVNRYVQTKKAGANYKALCPFHSEKTASFIISPAKNIAKCFSCGKGGGPIRFLMEIEGLEFREAAAMLAKEAGIDLKTGFFGQKIEKNKDPYLLYKMASDYYHRELYTDAGKKALEYLESRGISHETIKNFSLGYSHNPRDFFAYLRDQGFDADFLIHSGLFISPSRDKFFGRLIFPIANTMGNPVAFTGRILGPGEPKYLNSPASRIFDKSSILYGFHLAKQTIMKTGEAFVVEGQMDTVRLHQSGIDNAVGISGTALTQDHIRMLKRFAKIIYLALDADDAGIKATFLSIDNLLNSDLEIRIIIIPNGKDPDEFIKSGGDFSLLKKDALSVIDYYILMGDREFNLNTLVGQKKLIEKCVELVAKIISPIEVDFYIKYLAQKFEISRDALYQELHQKKRQIRQNLPKKPENPESNFEMDNYALLSGYLVKFSLFDLFFSKFSYTIDDIKNIPEAAFLYRVLSGESLDDEDTERLAVVELYIEENF